ncbi:hypothetical protein TVAG_422680 [Trichomonas vaginalis G3]|uniref:Uncharacterized protein n=1 Tax=Trichomonas vaginalis (strain ATCC PRA-98 / G3) TaxID=412133 RepID=A2G411_TRIV3|nr:hypothetical protein TVAGG3_0408770 [Trichomonas vaginalis G3]EAX88113.1 hypothetical protein TVAG_422680 [Trichomonas vaginalis G3]KAI5535204.1 hypothetical protein TVAGG3_0408770 [Trichomonas vaginalis G3]|eukprot:XP_001301043.1 hypothetical protein [Trichomonas vaginalis G3]
MRDNNSYNTLQHALAPAISGNIFYNLTDRRTIVVSDAFPNNVGLESELNIEYKSKNNYLCFNDVIFFDTTDIFANLSLSFQHYSLQTPKSILISESLNENLFNMAKTILEFSKPNISVKLINDTTSSCYKELANAEIYVSFHHNNSYLFPAMTNGLFILLIMPGVYPPYELYIDYVKKTNISFVEYYLESPEYINPSLMLEAINLSANFYNSSDGSRCNYRYLRVFENTQKIANAC